MQRGISVKVFEWLIYFVLNINSPAWQKQICFSEGLRENIPFKLKTYRNSQGNTNSVKQTYSPEHEQRCCCSSCY